jgi:gamma-glutamylputrescine oxidase
MRWSCTSQNIRSVIVAVTPYWLNEPPEPLPRRRLNGFPDVAVIGGGVTGCSCALTLAKRGASVRLFEAREIAGGASGRNGGFALRGAAVPYDELRGLVGSERARALMELTVRSLERLERLAGDAFRRTGSVRLAADDLERGALRREHDALSEDGFTVTLTDLEPPLDRLYHAALLHPGDGVHARPRSRAQSSGSTSRSRSPIWMPVRSSSLPTASRLRSCPTLHRTSGRRAARCS